MTREAVLQAFRTVLKSSNGGLTDAQVRGTHEGAPAADVLYVDLTRYGNGPWEAVNTGEDLTPTAMVESIVNVRGIGDTAAGWLDSFAADLMVLDTTGQGLAVRPLADALNVPQRFGGNWVQSRTQDFGVRHRRQGTTTTIGAVQTFSADYQANGLSQTISESS